MLNIKSNQQSKQVVEVIPHDVQIFFDAFGKYYFSLHLPTQTELDEFESVRSPSLSINSLVYRDHLEIHAKFENEYYLELSKYEKYRNSATYLNRLSNLAKQAGRVELAERYVEAAVTASPDRSYFKHELVRIQLDQDKYENAIRILNDCDMENDCFANLRMAYISVKQSDFELANRYVDKALEIDELDYAARMFAGTISIQKGEYEQSIRHYKVALESEDKSSPLYTNIAYSYWMTGQQRQARAMLQKALLINPLNRNAIIFYSDICSALGKSEEAIAFLEFYLSFEQQESECWERLGRACYEVAQDTNDKSYFAKSIEALKYQDSLNSSSTVWNNLGLNYWGMENYSKAQRFFGQSILKAEEEGESINAILPIYNLSLLLIKIKKYKEARGFLERYLAHSSGSDKEHRLYDQLKLFYVISVEGMGDYELGSKLALNFLEDGISNFRIRVDVQSKLLAYHAEFTLREDIIRKLETELIREIDDKKLQGKDSMSLRQNVINNLAFAYCNLEELDNAQDMLSRVSHLINKNPYVTATNGLLNIRKGRIEEGKEFYIRASGLLSSESERKRFKQRMYFELGKVYLLNNNYKMANSNFEKALSIKLDRLSIEDQIRSKMKLLLKR